MGVSLIAKAYDINARIMDSVRQSETSGVVMFLDSPDSHLRGWHGVILLAGRSHHSFITELPVLQGCHCSLDVIDAWDKTSYSEVWSEWVVGQFITRFTFLSFSNPADPRLRPLNPLRSNSVTQLSIFYWGLPVRCVHYRSSIFCQSVFLQETYMLIQSLYEINFIQFT